MIDFSERLLPLSFSVSVSVSFCLCLCLFFSASPRLVRSSFSCSSSSHRAPLSSRPSERRDVSCVFLPGAIFQKLSREHYGPEQKRPQKKPSNPSFPWAREWIMNERANKWAVQANERINGPVLTSGFLVILDHSAEGDREIEKKRAEIKMRGIIKNIQSLLLFLCVCLPRFFFSRSSGPRIYFIISAECPLHPPESRMTLPFLPKHYGRKKKKTQTK